MCILAICMAMGVKRINNNQLAPDLRDGDLVFYERLFAPNLEDVVIWKNGEVGRFNGEQDIIGRAVLLWRGREISAIWEFDCYYELEK